VRTLAEFVPVTVLGIAIDARGITFDLARNSQELGVLGRQRIKSFMLSAYEAFETTGMLS